MSLTDFARSITRPASGDLSAALYKFVHVDSSGNAVTPTVLGQNAIGVQLNKPTAAGQATEIQMLGVAKILATATINPGQKVATSATGTAVVAISTYHALGVCMKGGVTGDIIEVLLGAANILA